jgi:predicted SAM-dependent methyltransferase
MDLVTVQPRESDVDDLHTLGRKRAERRGAVARAATSILPEYLLKPLFWELQGLGVRLKAGRVARAFRGRKDLLVNLGAGDAGQPGWVNVDRFPGPNINCIYDARKKLPFDDGSVRGIFTEHFFEHVDYTEEVPLFLAECHRVMQPGGTIRIIVPDAEKYLHAYVSGDWEQLAAIRPLAPGRTDVHCPVRYNTAMELINVVFRQFEEHKFAYDFETLAFVLENAGFRNIRKQGFGETMAPEICLDLERRASESLYVEAVK